MNTQNSSNATVIAIKQKIEDYYSTIHALQAFISITTWDNGKIAKSHNSLGQRMITSKHNRVSPNQKVTPDAVIQRTTDLGYIVEAKKRLSDNTESL